MTHRTVREMRDEERAARQAARELFNAKRRDRRAEERAARLAGLPEPPRTRQASTPVRRVYVARTREEELAAREEIDALRRRGEERASPNSVRQRLARQAAANRKFIDDEGDDE